MADTKIAWANKVWNPVVGCSKVSLGCQNCYAEKMARRQVAMARVRGEEARDMVAPEGLSTWVAYSDVIDNKTGKWNGDVSFREDKLDEPLRWKKPCRIFVCSMGDLFHENVNIRGKEIEEIFRVMFCCDHTFLLLTKRPERMDVSVKYFYGDNFAEQMDNVWLGVSCENQEWAEKRISLLLQIPAAIRWLSLEPLLGPINLRMIHDSQITRYRDAISGYYDNSPFDEGIGPSVDWVVIGCESGPSRRLCKLEWVWDVVSQCKTAGLAVFVKQIEINGKVSHDIKQFPKDLQVREFPNDK